jgi:hypothetical protein
MTSTGGGSEAGLDLAAGALLLLVPSMISFDVFVDDGFY